MSMLCREAQGVEHAVDFIEVAEWAAEQLQAPVGRLEARLSTTMVCTKRRLEEATITLRVVLASKRGCDSVDLGRELLPRLALLHLMFLRDNGTEGVDSEFVGWLDLLMTRCPLAARYVREELEIKPAQSPEQSIVRSSVRPRRRALETLPPPRVTFSPVKRAVKRPTKRRKLVRLLSGSSTTVAPRERSRIVVPGSPIKSRRISSVAIPETP